MASHLPSGRADAAVAETAAAGTDAPARPPQATGTGPPPRSALGWLGGSSQSSNLAIKAASLTVLVIVWYLLTLTQGELLVPGPITVARELVDVVLNQDFALHMQKTLVRVLAGLAISMGVAVVAGVPMGLYRPIERFLEPYVLLGLTIPGLAWALIAVMIVGITDWAPIMAIAVTTSPMLMLNLWHGTKSIDTEVLQMGAAFRASRWLAIRHVVLPQLLPFVLAGTRLGLALAWKVVVLSEMFGLSNGVGYQLKVQFNDFSLAGVMAWTIAFTIVMAVIEFLVLRPIERHVTRWRPSVQGS